jgi:hypothetical protein
MLIVAGCGHLSGLLARCILSGALGAKVPSPTEYFNGWCQTDANLDKNEQLKYGETAEITTPNSRTKVYVAPTDEELLIARDTVRVITGEMHA